MSSLLLSGFDPISKNEFRDSKGENKKALKLDEKIQKVSSGAFHFLVLTINNNVYSFGKLGKVERSELQKIDLSFTKERIKDISCGYWHSLIVTESNELFTSGRNNHGELGLGDLLDRETFSKVDLSKVGVRKEELKEAKGCFSHSSIITKEGDLFVCGHNLCGELGFTGSNKHTFIKSYMSNIQTIEFGCAFSFILTKDNHIFVCGDNYRGQLGTGDFRDRSKFEKLNWANSEKVLNIVCGGCSSYILTLAQEVFVCGENLGQLGTNGENICVFTKIQTASNVKSISCAFRHCTIQLLNGDVMCIGNNSEVEGISFLSSTHSPSPCSLVCGENYVLQFKPYESFEIFRKLKLQLYSKNPFSDILFF